MTSDSPAGKEDIALCERLGQEHERLWDDPNKPIWRLSVLEHKNTYLNHDLDKVVDLAFICHHAISDGIGASAFHKSLLVFLEEACALRNPKTEWPVKIPLNISKPHNLEDFVNYRPKPDSSTTETPPSPNIWTASPPSLPSISEYSSQVKITTIPSENLQDILGCCHHLGITINGLLHSIITIQLSKLVHEAQGFAAITPYSMRRFSDLPSAEIANHVSYIRSLWPTSFLEKARSCSPNTSQEDTVITSISQQYQSEISDELEGVPSHGTHMLNNILAIRDFSAYCEEGLKGSRGNTYELSNIGVVTLPTLPEPASMKLEKLIFTQCGMVVGPAIGCGVVTLSGGPLVVSLHWQSGILGEEFMEELKCSLEERLLAFTVDKSIHSEDV